MVHIIKKFLDVGAPNVGIWEGLQKALGALNGCEKSLTLSTRPSIVNEGLVPDGDEIVVKQPMHHAVSHGRHGNLSPFIVADHEALVWTVLVSAVVKFSMKLREVFFQMVLELVHLLTHALAFAKLEPSLPHTS